MKTTTSIQEILAEDIPMIFLYVRDALPVVASRVRGVDPGPAGMLWNLPEWYVPDARYRSTPPARWGSSLSAGSSSSSRS